LTNNGLNLIENDIFHVHTFRCGHAENVSDEEYVKAAISIGARSIWFTDHAPFPGDPFGGRMKYKDLEEYICTLQALKKKYEDVIRIVIGLEIEYFPSFDEAGYYEQLKNDQRIEHLILGQHMAEEKPGTYTFSWTKERWEREEYKALGNAVIQGIETGYFSEVAHPDRVFRRAPEWNEDTKAMSGMIIGTSAARKIPIEVNIESIKTDYGFREEFWQMVGENSDIVFGLDAHSTEDVKSGFIDVASARKTLAGIKCTREV